MKFVISREALLKPLTLVTGVVERRQTLPVLSNVLIVVDGDQLSLTGTDLEVELVGRASLAAAGSPGEITVPARKLMDICKTLPDEADINFELDGDRAIIKSGRSRFTLSTLPATDFPNVDEGPQQLDFSIKQTTLRRLIDRTAIAMAQQDVRYYLNGMMFQLKQNRIVTVATDGHRLAMCEAEAEVITDEVRQVIVPRKGMLELGRLLANDAEESVKVVLSANHLRVITADVSFTSKLVDGKFPDYQQVIPKNGDKVLVAEREPLKQVLSRAAILSNEKYRGVRLIMQDNMLQVFANNPEQEEAEESLPVSYKGDALEIGFNVGYLLDVLSVTDNPNIRMTLADTNASALMEEAINDADSLYVVMPMRL